MDFAQFYGSRLQNMNVHSGGAIILESGARYFKGEDQANISVENV